MILINYIRKISKLVFLLNLINFNIKIVNKQDINGSISIKRKTKLNVAKKLYN
jgi:hypothetical protein